MLHRIIGAAALLVLAGCSQTDQKLPFELESAAPVMRTMGSGPTVISTPSGFSMTVPGGALPAGSGILVARLDNKAHLSGGPATAGDIYLIGFEGMPQRDPAIEFSVGLNQETTAGRLIGLVPIVARVQTQGQPASANLIPSGRAASQASATDATAAERMNGLRMDGTFQGVMGHGNLGEQITRAEMVTVLIRAFGSDANASLAGKGPPPFAAPANNSWFDEYIAAAKGLFASSPAPAADTDWWTSRIPAPGGGSGGMISRAFLDSLPDSWPDRSNFYLVSTAFASYVPVLPPHTGQGTAPSHPLLPTGATSATFELVCTAIDWPGAGLPLCDGKVIDVRAGKELLDRFPASVVVPNYLSGEVTLQLGGVATGSLAYGFFLRTALATGITGLGLEDEFDLAGTWSVSGDTLRVGGQRFQYSTPDAGSLVIAVSDSVRIKDKGGADSWQQVQAYLKLRRK